MNTDLNDILGSIQNLAGDTLDAADRVDFMSDIIVKAIKIKVAAQVEINADVEAFTNAFDMGGSLGDLEEMITASKGL